MKAIRQTLAIALLSLFISSAALAGDVNSTPTDPTPPPPAPSAVSGIDLSGIVVDFAVAVISAR